MSKISSLINEICQDEKVLRYKIIEKIIDQDEKMKNKFKELLELQKIMVQDENYKSVNYEISKSNYYNAKDELEKNILLHEYLDLLEEINNDLQLIQNIIISEINMDFE